MATHKSAIKRTRQNEKRRIRNQHYKSSMKTAMKGVLSSTEKETAEQKFQKTVSLLDRLVSKGIIHQNNAARKKSRLARYINSL